ncbi:3-hydroxy-9,10-secoandrosta-1,3,5(10)-triene-9,17-dione monooxygenase reductase component [Sphingobium faniae]|nr:3-hydroxy-9,10-secoandrosta-1,3,5(10)-triene-9,17-dione monooxygenase reductase component [Sphingobium faniae]
MIDNKQAFRSALGRFVTGVTIVTTRDEEGKAIGLTANSFNSVSLDPPLVLWSLALTSPNLLAFRNSRAWAVHVLAADQEDLSNRFATRGIDKFEGLSIDDGPEGAPLIPGCAARFGCRSTFEYEGGDHAIFVGEVVDFIDRDIKPLVFHGGKYGGVFQGAKETRPAELVHEGEFGRYFIGHLLNRAYQTAFVDVRREYRARGLRSSEYSVIVALGLGDGCPRAELIRRAANGAVDLPDAAIDGLIARGVITGAGDALHLTGEGRKILAELMAVAQSFQLQLESMLAPYELSQLTSLLGKLCSVGEDAG